MHISLQSRTAIVTGAARGIGRAIAEKLCAAGASVLLADVDEPVLRDTQQAMSAAGGGVEAIAGDLTRPDFPEAIVRKTLESFGSLDIIVNNAGYTWDNVI
ncbi:MAG: SDR family NAD(P)-dependent oxidoreductase, partial [Acidobacteriaceae bacterium]|nr:SDR family NAD(P)-dependent oxidoreductase [Acidobacteriaceae bacterium]